jgi:hypothetical protein
MLSKFELRKNSYGPTSVDDKKLGNNFKKRILFEYPSVIYEDHTTINVMNMWFKYLLSLLTCQQRMKSPANTHATAILASTQCSLTVQLFYVRNITCHSLLPFVRRPYTAPLAMHPKMTKMVQPRLMVQACHICEHPLPTFIWTAHFQSPKQSWRQWRSMAGRINHAGGRSCRVSHLTAICLATSGPCGCKPSSRQIFESSS